MIKYNILKIRAKISYSAYVKQITIQELIFKQIVKSYTHFYGEPNDLMSSKMLKTFFLTLAVCPLRHSLIMVSEYKKTGKAGDNFTQLGLDALALKLKLMTNKNEFFDIFQKVKVGGKHMFE